MTDALLGLLSPKNDFVFKQIFGDANDVDPLASFLQAALGLPEEEFADLTIIDPNLNAEYEDDKHCILDVHIKTRSGREIDVEIQVKPTPEFFNRIQCYTAKMVAGQVKSGDTYRNMAQSITIVITDFRLWERYPRYHHRFRLYDPADAIEYPNSMEIHMLELPKLPKDSDGTKLWDWLKFLSSETRDELASLTGKDKAMTKAIGRLMNLSADEAARLRADAHDKWEWDQWGRLRQSREEGFTAGIMQMVRRMLQLQLPIDVISKTSGLPESEIERLAKSN